MRFFQTSHQQQLVETELKIKLNSQNNYLALNVVLLLLAMPCYQAYAKNTNNGENFIHACAT
jgi:hypothetical protein